MFIFFFACARVCVYNILIYLYVYFLGRGIGRDVVCLISIPRYSVGFKQGKLWSIGSIARRKTGASITRVSRAEYNIVVRLEFGSLNH